MWGQLEDSLAPRGSQRRYRLHVSAALREVCGEAGRPPRWAAIPALRGCQALLGIMQGQEPPQPPPLRNAAHPRRVRYKASFRPG